MRKNYASHFTYSFLLTSFLPVLLVQWCQYVLLRAPRVPVVTHPANSKVFRIFFIDMPAQHCLQALASQLQS